MKQRIRTVGIIKSGEGILLLKRIMGRSEEKPTWELPTGKIRFGEQPEEALARAIFEHLGVSVSSVRLSDAVTFSGLSKASQLGNLYIVYNVELSDKKISLIDRYSAFKYVKREDVVALNLDEATASVLEIIKNHRELPENVLTNRNSDEYRKTANGATVYVDGGSRGNPGPAGIGYYILGENGEVLDRGGEFIGFATSRVAEYHALKLGCRKAIELGLKRVRFVSDNLMMINQMNGIYGIKNQDLMPMYTDIQKMLENFESVAFIHRKREFNTDADAEANLAIDRHFQKLR